MANRKFSMAQVDMAGKSYYGLIFRYYMEDETALTDPVIGCVFPLNIEYGSLFAYLFRRFGYPECGWDNYKELVAYYLTTPHPNMILKIAPHVGNISTIGFKFMVEKDTFLKLENAIQSEPYHRSVDVRKWDANDPLKPFAELAIVALEDLLTPVGVRDQAINALGKAETTAPISPSLGAGYPSGALGNSAPQEFAELHGLILKLGKGNAKRGMAKVVDAISEK